MPEEPYYVTEHLPEPLPPAAGAADPVAVAAVDLAGGVDPYVLTPAQRRLLDYLDGGDVTLGVLVKRQEELGALRAIVGRMAARAVVREELIQMQAEALALVEEHEGLLEALRRVIAQSDEAPVVPTEPETVAPPEPAPPSQG